MTARRDPHNGPHTETGAMPGEHSGRSRNPLVEIAGLAWLEFEKPDLARAERLLVDFGFAVADRSPEALVPECHGEAHRTAPAGHEVAAVLPEAGPQPRRDPDALLHGSPARFVGRPSLRGYLGQLYAITGWTSLPWLHRLRQPTLVLAWDDDSIVPLPNGRILAHRIPNARLHTVHGGGHLFLLERPAEMAALVTRCLAERW